MTAKERAKERAKDDGRECVSIVIPVRNRPELVVRCLESVARQSWRPLLVIVVDNNSSDSTPQAVERFFATHPDPGITYTLLHEEKPGACAARNRGLGAVDTRMVSFFDSDDAMRPSLVSDAMSLSEGADIVSWECVVNSPDGSQSVKSRLRGDIMRRQMFNAFFRTQAYMVDADFLRRAGGWREDASVWNDWELGIRLLLNRPRHRHVARILTDIYPQPVSITGTAFSKKAGEWEHTLSVVEEYVADSPDCRRLKEMIDYRRVVLAAIYRREGARGLAERLLRTTLQSTTCSPARKLLLRLIYRYTAAGGRAAYLLWK